MCNTSKKVLFFWHLIVYILYFMLTLNTLEHFWYNATHVRIPEHVWAFPLFTKTIWSRIETIIVWVYFLTQTIIPSVISGDMPGKEKGWKTTIRERVLPGIPVSAHNPKTRMHEVRLIGDFKLCVWIWVWLVVCLCLLALRYTSDWPRVYLLCYDSWNRL